MTSSKHVSLGADDAVLSGQPAEDVVGRTARRARAVVLLSVTYATEDILFLYNFSERLFTMCL